MLCKAYRLAVSDRDLATPQHLGCKEEWHVGKPSAGAKIADLCGKHGITETTFHRWKRKYGDLRSARRGGSRRWKRRIGASSSSWLTRRWITAY